MVPRAEKQDSYSGTKSRGYRAGNREEAGGLIGSEPTPMGEACLPLDRIPATVTIGKDTAGSARYCVSRNSATVVTAVLLLPPPAISKPRHGNPSLRSGVCTSSQPQPCHRIP